jgi:UTP--glucose-1-phosphate uridylyltransferase
VIAGVDAATRSVLERFGFDSDRFERLRERVRSGELSAASNVVTGEVQPPAPGDVQRLPAAGDRTFAEIRAAGLEALAAGRVAAVVLNGGMATRFGGTVKGVVEAVDGRSFLEIKLRETERLAAALGVRIPTALMTSFATDEVTRAFLAERGARPLLFSQFVSLRLTPAGELFLDPDGRPSLYGPGHGDLLEAIRSSGVLGELRAAGVSTVAVSNVDNLGARLDPVVIGAHLRAGRPMTVEVARRDGDTGGAPARVDDRLLLLETPRFPPGFDHDRLAVFNTNTALIDLHVLDRDYDLSWLYVEKEVAGRRAVQLERLYHELAAFVPTTCVEVPRTGPRGRFFPVKAPADLERARPLLREMLAASPLDV